MVTAYLLGLKTLTVPESFDSVSDFAWIFQSETPLYSKGLKGWQPVNEIAEINRARINFENPRYLFAVKFINKDCRNQLIFSVKKMTANNSKIPLLIEIQCFGNINFWIECIKSGYVMFEQFEQFQKTGFRNRYQVLGANNIITLSVPVAGGRESREKTSEIRIDNRQFWQKNHWKTLESCYNKSPFFFHYAPGLHLFFKNPYNSLWQFNLEVFQWTARQLKVNIVTGFTGSFSKDFQPNETRDLRGIWKTSDRETYFHSPYCQVFGNKFQQNLSILDLLFNLGPQSASYLKNQQII